MSDIGRLGIPLRFWQSESAARSSAFYEAIGLPAVQAVKQRLAADPRFQALEGKSVACGEGGGSVPERSLLAWWAWRANDVGPEQADRELETFLSSDEIDGLVCVWLFGTFVNEVVELSDGIEMWPLEQMPYSVEKVEFRNHMIGPLSQIIPAPRSALVKKIRVPKIRPWPPDPPPSVGPRLTSLALLLNLLPDVAASICCHCNYYPDNIAPGVFGNRGMSMPLSDAIVERGALFANSEGIDLSALLDAFQRKPEKERQKLWIALQRIQNAKGRIGNPENKALDLGIALERLLLDNEHGDQLSLTFRLRGAWLVGKDADDRISVHDTLKEVYEIRSAVAHFGAAKKLKTHEPYRNTLAAHFRVAEKIARKIVLDGTPDWKKLILDAGSSCH